MYTKKKKIAFNIQRFANDKLISLDRMKDFLDGSKNIFYMESDLASENEISGIVEDQLIPKPVDLSYYAKNSIPDYQNTTEIPQENLEYLNSGLIASNMRYMFYDCYKLQSIPKLNIDTSQCIDMGRMFYYCQVLTTIDLSNWDTSNVTNMNSMFYNCRNLEHIEGIIDMKSCTRSNYSTMFYNCTKLSGVKIKNPPDNFESVAGLTSSQYEIVS